MRISSVCALFCDRDRITERLYTSQDESELLNSLWWDIRASDRVFAANVMATMALVGNSPGSSEFYLQSRSTSVTFTVLNFGTHNECGTTAICHMSPTFSVSIHHVGLARSTRSAWNPIVFTAGTRLRTLLLRKAQ